MSKITLIDYSIGNLLSVERALAHLGADYSIARSVEEIDAASKLILPGVGAFASCTGELEKRGFMEPIRKAVTADKPILGICVGMQMLFERSEEFGVNEGFGFIKGTVKPIPFVSTVGQAHKIPHIGWTSLVVLEDGWDDPILDGVEQGAEVYFVHSFTAHPQESKNRVADAYYGGQRVSAIVKSGNTYGTQFHPEKSGPVGLKILDNFLKL